MGSADGLWQSWHAKILGLFRETPLALRFPEDLGVVDMGTRPEDAASWWVHEVDCHAGHDAAVDELIGRGYEWSLSWRDAEGLLVCRWQRRYSRAEIQALRNATEAA